jgi:ATP-dependent exoDNAse (exonuclease V) beta subunit
MTATEAAMTRGGDDQIDVAVESIPGGESRPRGARFGTLVHALLADAPLDAPGTDAIASLADAHGRILGADATEVSAAAAAVQRVLAHPLLRGAAAAARGGRCYRETPVTYRLDGRGLIEGQVDLAYWAGEEFVIIDFKTDRAEGDLLEQYRRQVRLYADAIARATGRSTRAVLMQI